jgi:uncharacterized protein
MLRPSSAAAAAEVPPATWDLGVFEGRKQCLVITYRKSGKAVPTPVWFAVSGDLLVFKTGASSGKVKRLRRDPRLRIVPCTFRGRPLDRPMEGVARFLEPGEGADVERTLRARYGLGRRLYYRFLGPKEFVYLEVASPAEVRPDTGLTADAPARRVPKTV